MNKKQVIALLTDFGTEDHYVGVMKGVILTINPNVTLVDISHKISAQNILEGALILRSSYRYFPPKTIFLTVVDPGVGSKRKAIIVQTKHYSFVAPDNGIVSPTLNEEPPTAIYSIENDRYFLKPVSTTFHGRDIFAPVAGNLSKGLLPARFGKKQKKLVNIKLPEAVVAKATKSIKGMLITIDHFGNLITNIESKHFNLFKGPFAIKIKNTSIDYLTSSYAVVSKKQLLAIIGSSGYLEISVNQGSASQKLKAKIGDTVQLVFR